MIVVDKYKCGYCGVCVAVCPLCAIELVSTWIEIGEECKGCGVCAQVCPMGAIEVKHEG